MTEWEINNFARFLPILECLLYPSHIATACSTTTDAKGWQQSHVTTHLPAFWATLITKSQYDCLVGWLLSNSSLGISKGNWLICQFLPGFPHCALAGVFLGHWTWWCKVILWYIHWPWEISRRCPNNLDIHESIVLWVSVCTRNTVWIFLISKDTFPSRKCCQPISSWVVISKDKRNDKMSKPANIKEFWQRRYIGSQYANSGSVVMGHIHSLSRFYISIKSLVHPASWQRFKFCEPFSTLLK